MMRMARPGPGNGCRQTIRSGSPSASPRAHLVLEELAQRLDKLDGHVLWKAADVVVALDGGGVAAAGLDHVRVERALDQEAGGAERLGLALEDANELPPDDLALLLRVGDAAQALEEVLLSPDDHQRHLQVTPEGLLHLLGLVVAQEAVVHEHAGEPV